MKYYLQNRERGYVGNCILWWRVNDTGYTTELGEAEVFTDETEEGRIELRQLLNGRDKFVAPVFNFYELSVPTPLTQPHTARRLFPARSQVN